LSYRKKLTEKSWGESSIMIPVNDRIATSVDEVASHVVSTARLDGFYECTPPLPSVSNLYQGIPQLAFTCVKSPTTGVTL